MIIERRRLLGTISEAANNTLSFLYSFLKIILFICLFFGYAGSSFLHGLVSSCREQGLLSRGGAWLLIAVASLAEQRLQGMWASVVAAHGFWSTGSVVVVHGLSCSMACGIFQDQWSNLCLLHWQMYCLPLSHQGNPILYSFIFFNALIVS